MTKPGRVCAVCGKSNGTATYGFKTALHALGLPNWQDDKAHPACVKRLRVQRAMSEVPMTTTILIEQRDAHTDRLKGTFPLDAALAQRIAYWNAALSPGKVREVLERGLTVYTFFSYWRQVRE